MTTLGSRRRIILINRYFYADHTPTGDVLSSLAFALVPQGFRFEVITSRLSYDEAKVFLRPRADADPDTHGADRCRAEPQVTMFHCHCRA